MKSLKYMLLLCCCCVAIYSYGQNEQTSSETTASCGSGCCCAGGNQAPIGVATDHIHSKGQWMFSYSYMDMMMKGNREGTSVANDDVVYEKYMMAPGTMNMQMHMLMAMYGVTDQLTLMAMGGYALYNMSMNMSDAMMSMPGMNMAMGDMTMLTTSSGFTDTKLSALYNFSGTANRRIIGSMGIGLPTGTIRATGTTMLGQDQRVPYDMQPGTGSFSIAPGITYVRNYPVFSYGADAGADIKLNKNALGYKAGNVYHASAWAGYKLFSFMSCSLRGEFVHADKITGSDPQIAIPVYEENDPTTNTANYGGQWVNVYAGLNFHFMQPVLKHFTFLAEYGLPVYQNLNGVQMALHGNVQAGVQYSF